LPISITEHMYFRPWVTVYKAIDTFERRLRYLQYTISRIAHGYIYSSFDEAITQHKLMRPVTRREWVNSD